MTQTNTVDRPRFSRSGADWTERESICPPANIFAGKDEYLIELEMPGVNKEGLAITVDDNELTVTGRRASEPMPGEAVYCESTGQQFCRRFELSNDVDSGKIRAELNQGLLRVHLPKAERAKPKKITIQG